MDDHEESPASQPNGSPSGEVPAEPAAAGPPSGPPAQAPATGPSGGAPATAGAGRQWRTWQLAVACLITLVVGVGIGAAIGSGTDESDDPSTTPAPRDQQNDGRDDDSAPVTSTTLSRTTTTTASPADDGSRESPYALGTPLRTDDGWELTVNSVNFDAASEIAATNQFNDPAPPGLRYVLVNATYTNGSSEPGNPSFTVSIEMIGSQNRLWDISNASCTAVIPEPVNNAGELFPGGTFTGNSCLQVPEAEVTDGSLLVAVSTFFGDDTVFVRTS